MGSGKSTVCNMLVDLGAKKIDADEVGHSIYLPGTPGYKAVIDAFGNGITDLAGVVDRKKLSNIVFEDESKRLLLNKITHPLIEQSIRTQLKEYKDQGVDVVALEAALLIEAGYTKMVNEVWLTVAPLEVLIDRLHKSRGMDKNDVMRRIRTQLSINELRHEADNVITTTNPIPYVAERVRYLYNHLK